MGSKRLRIAKGRFDREMVLERNFPLHAFSSIKMMRPA
jgi:hypothetical protein